MTLISTLFFYRHLNYKKLNYRTSKELCRYFYQLVTVIIQTHKIMAKGRERRVYHFPSFHREIFIFDRTCPIIRHNCLERGNFHENSRVGFSMIFIIESYHFEHSHPKNSFLLICVHDIYMYIHTYICIYVHIYIYT